MLDHQTYDNRGSGGGSKSATPVGGGTVTDPVCGINVDPVTSKHRVEQGGQSYFFCCEGRRTMFAAGHTA
jgi:Cu+-exporting ATPase